MEKKHAAEYAALHKAFKESGVDNMEAIEIIRTRIKHRTALAFVIVLGILALLFLVSPNLVPIASLLAVVILAWVVSTTAHGARHIQRYIHEEIDRPKAND